MYTDEDCKYSATNHPDLLSVEADPRTKNGLGWLVGIGFMSPYKGIFGTGANLCTFATDPCIKDCIGYTGRARADETSSPIHRARETRRRLFLDDRDAYFKRLRVEVGALVRKAIRRGLRLAVRLNGTTDVLWETYPAFLAIQDEFSGVVWYDYTKIPIRHRSGFKGHLTFSWSGENENECRLAVLAGHNIAVPYHGQFPETDTIGGITLKVVSGDESDLRFLDRGEHPHPVIVGLRIVEISTKRRNKDDTPSFGKRTSSEALLTDRLKSLLTKTTASN